MKIRYEPIKSLTLADIPAGTVIQLARNAPLRLRCERDEHNNILLVNLETGEYRFYASNLSVHEQYHDVVCAKEETEK